MNHADFRIGKEFWCSDGLWRCTDIGQRHSRPHGMATKIKTKRTVTGAEAEREGWFDGPPYGVAECVFDEYDLEACTLTREEQ